MSSSSVANPEMQNPDVVIGAQQFPNPKGIVPQADDEIENSAPTYAGTPLTGGARMNVDNASGATFDTSNPPRAQLLPAQARHLDIKQGPLLPMPKERPIDVDTGYRETPDSLTTTGYTTQPAPIPNHSRVVAYPNGAHVAFPDSLTAQEFSAAAKRSWDFLKNEAVGAGQAIVGLPSAIADSVTVAPTADEQKTLGVPANPSLAQKAALALYRNLSEPIANAAQFYGTLVKHHQSIIDAIPSDVLAQGLGAGAGAAVLGKVLAPSEETTGVTAKPAVKPTSLKPIAAPLAGEVKPVAPLSPESRAAAAYLAKNRATLPTDAVEEVTGRADRPKGEINIGGKTSGPSIPEATATPEEIRAYIKHAYPDAADAVLKDEKPEVATSEDVNKTAEKAAQGIQARVEYSKQAGDLIDTHRVDVSSDNGGPRGHLTAIEDKSNPRTWTIDTAQISPEGTGAGLRAYTELANRAKSAGAELQSGSVVSDAAQRVWDKLKGQGFDVQEVEGLGGKTYRIPAPEKKPPQFDLTDDWKNAWQDDLATKGQSGASGRNARRAEPVQTVIPGTGVEEVNPEVPDTRPDVPTFYSKAERVAQEKVPNNASGDQILATLRNNGVKENEIGWMGLDDFLKDKPKVSKSDLQQFVKDNQIQLDEVNRPASGTDSKTLVAEKNTIHDYINAVRGRNVDSPLGRALDVWLQDEGPESTSKLLSHPDMSPELASQISRYDQLDEQLKGAPERSAKYSKYVLDGPKENYNEKLLTLPEKSEPITKFPEGMKVIKTSTGDYWVADEDGYDVTRNEYGDQHTFATPEKAREAALEAMNNGPFAKKYRGLNSQSFKNPHFEEPNVLAHVRHDDRIDTDGKKNLFLEEIQSDWHQAGKQEGYRVPVDTKELARQLDNANDAYQTVSKRLAANPEDAQAKADAHAAFQETQRLERAYNAATAQRGVPDAPFKNDWHELVMKRMLREAAEKGYDRLSWTTGDQQAERYDLSKHIGRVEYDPEKGELSAWDPHGEQVLDGESVEPDDLEKYIGKDPAERLRYQISNYSPTQQEPDYDHLYDYYGSQYEVREIEPEEEGGETMYGVFAEHDSEPLETFDSEQQAERSRERYVESDVNSDAENFEPEPDEKPSINGLDLKVGGEWARALYDRAIPNFMNKHLKRWGVKVGTRYIPVGEGEKGGLHFHLIAPNGELYDAFRTRQQAEDALKSVAQPGTATRWHIQDHSPDDEAVHSIDITPEMKRSVLKVGQPIAKAEQPSWQDIALSKLGNQAA